MGWDAPATLPFRLRVRKTKAQGGQGQEPSGTRSRDLHQALGNVTPHFSAPVSPAADAAWWGEVPGEPGVAPAS